MKTIRFFVALPLIIFSVIGAAQVNDTTFHVGDTWIYSGYTNILPPEQRPKFEFSIIKDTMMDNKKFHLLSKPSSDQFSEISKIWLRKANNKVTFWYEGKEYLLYDFSLTEGDTFTYYIPFQSQVYEPRTGLNFTDSKPIEMTNIVVLVDDFVWAPGKVIKRLHLEPIWPPTDNCQNYRYIYEGLGGRSGFFSFPCFFITEGYYGELHCFRSGNDIVTIVPGECKATKTEDEYSSNITIYPNPSNDWIHIDANVHFNEVNIFDMHSQKILISIDSTVDTTVDIFHLPAGMYVVEIISRDHVIHRQKVVVY
jgi:hypothetical protein